MRMIRLRSRGSDEVIKEYLKLKKLSIRRKTKELSVQLRSYGYMFVLNLKLLQNLHVAFHILIFPTLPKNGFSLFLES